MIIVHGFVTYRHAQRERALLVFDDIARIARNESGCQRYEVYQGTSGSPTLFLLQEWDSLDALSAHFRATGMDPLVRALPDVLDGEIETRRFEIPDIEPPAREAQRLVLH